jgi:hypothetical protein
MELESAAGSFGAMTSGAKRALGRKRLRLLPAPAPRPHLRRTRIREMRQGRRVDLMEASAGCLAAELAEVAGGSPTSPAWNSCDMNPDFIPNIYTP